MIDVLLPWLLAAIPLGGALAAYTSWGDHERVKNISMIGSAVSLVSVMGFAGFLTTPPSGDLALYLLPLAALSSILGHPLGNDHRLSWIMTLACLGLGMGAMTAHGPSESFFLIMLLATLVVLLYRHHTELWPISWWGVGLLVLGFLAVGVSGLADPPISSIAALATCAVLLPLVPLHAGYLTTVTRLPGNLPSFVVILLPVIGFHRLSTILSATPEDLMMIVRTVALAGSLYAGIKALAQSRVRLILGYGSLSFFSIAWWFAATTGSATPHGALLVGAVGLATSGLLIAWQVIRTRYGDDVDPQAISGLAGAMPKFAVLLSLLGLAAMGIPPFGVFAGFMGLLLTSSQASVFGLFLTLSAWLAASWYIMQMVQQLLFGTSRPDLRHTDLLKPELASLIIVVVVLLALGLAPSAFFAPEQPILEQAVLPPESFAWPN